MFHRWFNAPHRKYNPPNYNDRFYIFVYVKKHTQTKGNLWFSFAKKAECAIIASGDNQFTVVN